MARIFYLASKYPRLGESVSKTFQNSRVDASVNRTIHFVDLDFECHEISNSVSNELAGYTYTIHHHDLDRAKRYNVATSKNPLSIEEFIEGIKESLSEEWKGGGLKIVVVDEYKKEIKKLLDAGKISNGNIISDKIMAKLDLSVDPIFDDEELTNVDDSEISSLADIRKKVSLVADKKKRQLNAN